MALRWLVEDCLRRNDLAGAERYSSELLPSPHVELPDRLDHLNILQQTKNPQFNDYLHSVQRDAATNVSATYAVGISADAGTRYGGGCPAMVDELSGKASRRTACAAGTGGSLWKRAGKDWLGLDAFLVGQQWHDLEFLRFAYLSRASEELEQQMAAEARWQVARSRATDNQLGSFWTTLLNMARNWRPTSRPRIFLLAQDRSILPARTMGFE